MIYGVLLIVAPMIGALVLGRYHFDRSVVENRVELLTEGAEANCM